MAKVTRSGQMFQSAPHFSSEANALISSSVLVSKIQFQSAPHFSSEANAEFAGRVTWE